MILTISDKCIVTQLYYIAFSFSPIQNPLFLQKRIERTMGSRLKSIRSEYNNDVGSYLEFFGIKILQVLLRQDLIKSLEESLRLFFDASGQPPLSYQPEEQTRRQRHRCQESVLHSPYTLNPKQ